MPLFQDAQTFFVKETAIVATPANGNDGMDPIGLALVNASYVHTGGGSGERQLTLSGAFSAYTHTAGDVVWLLNAAGGIVTGLYEISSKVDANVILLVDDPGLTADSTADVDSSNGPWGLGTAATGTSIQHAADTATAATGSGTIVFICDDGNGTGTVWQPSGTATIDFDTNNPTLDRCLIFCGATGRGAYDETVVATISGVDMTSANNTVDVTTNSARGFMNLRFTAGNSANNIRNNTSALDNFFFLRCRFDGATGGGGNGCLWQGDDVLFVDCEFDANGGRGFVGNPGGTNTGRSTFLRCRIHDNTGVGIEINAHTNIINCLIYDNTGAGVFLNRHPGYTLIDGCTIERNDGGGVNFGTTAHAVNSGSGVIVSNCAIANNGTPGGIDSEGGSNSAMRCIEVRNSLANGNTTADFAATCNTFPLVDTLTSAPAFTLVTDGSEDYTPATGSPLIDVGIQVPVK